MSAAGMAATLAVIAGRDRITEDQAARNRIAEGLERLATAIELTCNEGDH